MKMSICHFALSKHAFGRDNKQKGYAKRFDIINNNEEKVNNSHLAATLCLKYAYFARNKLIHAENIESGFRLVPLNKEEEEVTWLSGMLVLLIVDLINANFRFQ